MPRRRHRSPSIFDESSQATLPGALRPVRTFGNGVHGTSRRLQEHHYRQAEYERASRARAAAWEQEEEERRKAREAQPSRRRRSLRAVRR